jgi:spore maturation protein CgeB
LASDPSIFSPKSNNTYRDIDVLFIGNRYGARTRIVDFLIESGIKVNCWGGGWSNGYASAEQSAAMFKRAKIILGIGTVGYCDDVFTLKLRDFDAPMSGALYVTHRNRDLLELYREGEEIVCYETDQECFEKIRYYLKHHDARERIAKAGLQKALSRDTWDHRISTTLHSFDLLTLSEKATK